MSLPVKTGLPDALDIGGGYTLRFTALDPTTGALVSGVVVSAVSILVDSGSVDSFDLGTYKPVLLRTAGAA